jgi:hypothetical protein
MSADRDILAIPDSTAWRAGVLHERERLLRIATELAEEVVLLPISFAEKIAARRIMGSYITAIRETP